MTDFAWSYWLQNRIDATLRASWHDVFQGSRSIHLQVGFSATLLAHETDVHAREHEKWTAIHFAARFQNIAGIRILLEHGAEVDARDVQQTTPLLAVAGGSGDVEAIRVLLEHGADVHAETLAGQSAIELASFWGGEDAIRTLLAWGQGLISGI